MELLQYPIGKFDFAKIFTHAEINEGIKQIELLPGRLKEALAGLSEEQADTPYRTDGWTVRQVVHHLADSHLNAYIRFRLALTEDKPTIKPYNEGQWAELVDARTADAKVSLTLLDSLHTRWVILLKSLSPEDIKRELIHPELGDVALSKIIGLYAWHGNHHLAHITGLRDRMKW